MSWQQSPQLRTFSLFALIVAICLGSFYLISAVLIPVIVSFTLYALFQPAMLYLVRQNFNHSLSILVVLVLLVLGSSLIIAFVLPAGGTSAEPDELLAHCRERMAAFKRPRTIHVVQELPKTATGKIKRFVLRDQVTG